MAHAALRATPACISSPRRRPGHRLWQFGRTSRPIPVGATAIAGWKEPFPAFPRNMDECPPASYDATARLAYMDEIGAWASALYAVVEPVRPTAFEMRNEG